MEEDRPFRLPEGNLDLISVSNDRMVFTLNSKPKDSFHSAIAINSTL